MSRRAWMVESVSSTVLLFAALLSPAGVGAQEPSASRVALVRDDKAGSLSVRIDGAERLAYQYGGQLALPHLWPLRSPSGKLLTERHPKIYPHHRSFWFADKIQLGDGPTVDFYHTFKNYRQRDNEKSGYRHFIRHVDFDRLESADGQACFTSRLQWIVDGDTPAIDETRAVRVVDLGAGEMLVDVQWKWAAGYGPVHFHSDWVHYGWPFVRIHPQFSGEMGGTIADDRGRLGQAQTNGECARWIDVSNEVCGVTEGMALFPFPQSDSPTGPKWLTREYGTFGPRRADAQSGVRFTLDQGKALEGRAAVLIHRGDASSGRVAERYAAYCQGEL